MGRVALIDGDIIAYSCGFASDAAAAKDGMAYEPWGFCRHGVDATIQAIKEAAGAEEHVVVLTAHGGGYRDEVFPAYKAGRTAAKPHYYAAIREHLINVWGGFESAHGREADDELGILAAEYGERGVICTKDKDLDCVPGLHYNFSKTRKATGVYMVSTVEADRFFYKQMLTGDFTDNIPGMFRILGMKATAKWLSPIDDMTDPKEMYSYVREVYGTLFKEQQAMGKLPDHDYNLTDPKALEAFLLFLGTLLWIQREDGSVFRPPHGIFSGVAEAHDKEEEAVVYGWIAVEEAIAEVAKTYDSR